MLAAAALVATASVAGGAYAAGPGHDRIVSEVPAAKTPAANNGAVYGFAQVGGLMLAGGTFTSITPPGGSAQARSYLVGFDAGTGALSSTFKPVLNGAVQSLQPGPTSNTVYVAGNFTTVNGKAASHVVLLDVNTGALVTSFKAATTNGVVNSIVRRGSRLYLGGNFTKAGGIAHGGLATVNASTGALDPFMNVQLSQRHNDTGSGALGAVGTKELAINAQGDRLAVLGNFKKADGLSRDQLALVSLDGATATVTPDWATARYTPYCFNWAYDSYVRDVSFSPDGTWFVVTATGGHNTGTLCDTAARFETYTKSTTVEPTWVDDTGGDTLWSNTVTEQAVYVGGHQRWVNNPTGNDDAKPGAVARPGIAALDPDTGLPLAWNPGRNPRGAAAYVVYATSSGLWVGSDTDYIGDYRYRRPKIAFFPLAGGQPKASQTQNGLPGEVYLAGQFSATNTNALRETSFDGATAGSSSSLNNQGIAWDNVRGGFLLGNKLFYGQSDGAMYERSFDGTTFGPATKLNPYHDPLWMNVDNGSGGTYDGSTSDLYAQLGKVTGMFFANGRMYYTRSGSARLLSRGFSPDSGIVGAAVTNASGGINWSDTQGMFYAGGKVYRVIGSTGQLKSYALSNGVPVGPGTAIASSIDWRSRVLFVAEAATATPAANAPPTAGFTSSCAGQICSFDASGSSDSDGTVQSYAWDFGDGSTGTGRTTSHAYSRESSYPVTLSVVDDNGASSASVTHDVDVRGATPPPTGDVTFQGQSAISVSSRAPSVYLPSAVRAGDQLFLTGTYNTSPVTVRTPPGWTLVGSRDNSRVSSYLWTKTAVDGDASSKTTTSLGARAKASLTALDYRGVDTASPVAGFAIGVDGAGVTTHKTPTVTTSGPTFVVESWQAKSSADTTWTVPPGTTSRVQSHGSAAGQTAVLDADSGSLVSAGSAGGHTSTSSVATSRGIAWTIAVRPAK